jgi:hypothetical protein
MMTSGYKLSTALIFILAVISSADYSVAAPQVSGSCSFSLSSTVRVFTAEGGSSAFQVSGGTGCAWSAVVSSPDWVTISSGFDGTGNGSVAYLVAPNAGFERQGSIIVSGIPHIIRQAGDPAASQQWKEVRPFYRSKHAMAYDSARRQVVMFGGWYHTQATAFLVDAVTWLWDGEKWTGVKPALSPPPMIEHKMAYDAARRQVVLFGPPTLQSPCETWIWDGYGWSRKLLSKAPPVRYGFDLAYDEARKQVVLFGGTGDAVVYAHTWVWDGSNWTQLSPAQSPPALTGHAMAYDSARGEVILFGGEAYYERTISSDTWAWNGTTWRKLNPAQRPPFNEYHRMVYDSDQARIVLFGGYDTSKFYPRGDTWVWNGTNWTKVNPSKSPGPRWDHAMAYDAARRQTLLFDGCYEDNDTWVFSGNEWSEKELGPPGSHTHAMFYDPLNEQTVFFGGMSPTGAQDQTWAWKENKWSRLTWAQTPPAGYGRAFAFDEVNRRVVLFVMDDRSTQNTWTWDGKQWTLQHPVQSPPPAELLGMAYDEIRKRVILFIGGDKGATWSWDGSNWTELHPAHTPLLTSAVAMTYDAVRGQVVLIGDYKSTYDYLNQTWVWDGVDWTRAAMSSQPRSGPLPVLAYDTKHGQVLLVTENRTTRDPGNGTWAWNGRDWVDLKPSASMPVRWDNHGAYDIKQGQLVMFGGIIPGVASGNDTWVWNDVIAEPCTAPTITAHPASAALDAGGTVSLQITAMGTQPLEYQWYEGIQGNTAKPVGTGSEQFTSPSLAASTSYWVRVRNACGQADSQAAIVTVRIIPISSANLSLSAGGAAATSTLGPNGGLIAGYVAGTVASGSAPYGTAVFSYTQNGVVVSEVGVPASPPTPSARFFVDTRTNVRTGSGSATISVYTGFAAVNANATAANLTLRLRDGNGAPLAQGVLRLAPSEHIAKFLDQLTPDFVLPAGFAENGFGALEITSDQPVSILALRLTINERGDLLLTSTPIADLSRPAPTGTFSFPQITDGGGYRTTLIFMNTSAITETGAVRFYGNNGAALPVRMTGAAAADSRFAYSIPAGGTLRLVTDGSPAAVNVGWAQLIPDTGISAPVSAAVFSLGQAGTLVTESGVPTAIPTTRARIYVDKSGGHDTGLAVANPGGSAIRITATAYQLDGVTRAGSGAGTLDLAPMGHDARFAGQLIAGLPEGFVGVLELQSPAPFTALTLRSLTNGRGDFLITTFPIADANQVPSGPLLFPQIANGGGYQTQVILLSTAGAVSKVTVTYRGNDGSPIAIGTP